MKRAGEPLALPQPKFQNIEPTGVFPLSVLPREIISLIFSSWIEIKAGRLLSKEFYQIFEDNLNDRNKGIQNALIKRINQLKNVVELWFVLPEIRPLQTFFGNISDPLKNIHDRIIGLKDPFFNLLDEINQSDQNLPLSNLQKIVRRSNQVYSFQHLILKITLLSEKSFPEFSRICLSCSNLSQKALDEIKEDQYDEYFQYLFKMLIISDSLECGISLVNHYFENLKIFHDMYYHHTPSSGPDFIPLINLDSFCNQIYQEAKTLEKSLEYAYTIANPRMRDRLIEGIVKTVITEKKSLEELKVSVIEICNMIKLFNEIESVNWEKLVYDVHERLIALAVDKKKSLYIELVNSLYTISGVTLDL